jgi:multidrug resistance efflux pump
MTPPRLDPPPSRPRLRLSLWLVGVLLASSAGLTAWALYSRADAPSASASASAAPAHSDLHYNFLGYADLEQGVTPLYPLQPGRVVKVFYHDGEHVEAGKPLFALDQQAATDLIAEAQADLDDAQIQGDDAQLQLKQADKLEAQHQAQIDGQKQALEARKQEAVAAHAKADLAQRLNKSETHAVSDEDAHAAEALAKAADAAAAGEEAKLHLLELDDPSIAVQRAKNVVQRAKNAAAGKQAQLRTAQDKLREYTIQAPTDGVVERMQVSVGEALGPNPQQPAVMFAADGPRIIRAEVEQEWANHVALDMTAVVQDFSATGPTWHGRVTRLSDWYTHRRSIMLEPLQFNDVRTLECIVTLDPGQPPLRIGQRVRVTLEGGN